MYGRDALIFQFSAPEICPRVSLALPLEGFACEFLSYVILGKVRSLSTQLSPTAPMLFELFEPNPAVTLGTIYVKGIAGALSTTPFSR